MEPFDGFIVQVLQPQDFTGRAEDWEGFCKVLGKLNVNGTTRTKVRVYCANSMDKMVGFSPSCPQTIQSHPHSLVEGVVQRFSGWCLDVMVKICVNIQPLLTPSVHRPR